MLPALQYQCWAHTTHAPNMSGCSLFSVVIFLQEIFIKTISIETHSDGFFLFQFILICTYFSISSAPLPCSTSMETFSNTIMNTCPTTFMNTCSNTTIDTCSTSSTTFTSTSQCSYHFPLVLCWPEQLHYKNMYYCCLLGSSCGTYASI